MADEVSGVKMNFHPPDEESQNNRKVIQKKVNRKRKKKFARRNSQFGVGKNKKKQSKLAHSMSTWAENFTVAATWQIKHQLAYWKARAKALEYENSVLHEIIRKKNYVDSSAAPSTREDLESEDEEDFEENDDQVDDFEVSEEFLQFLQANAKYKEDARRERERLKAKVLAEESAIERLEAGPPENVENSEDKLKELYGDRWQRIAALEMSLQSQFIDECDKEKPEYWPNIPFNFNFG
ncbi:unnamed protein product [Chilo suppressalis]|uniref:Gem-associated protein 8 n=1 Tax=Chilo suppressalis TaxID=168631 RepID=A0ABN8BAK0_CHISP|nr:unnamed protein product [Chilo suppressalis]